MPTDNEGPGSGTQPEDLRVPPPADHNVREEALQNVKGGRKELKGTPPETDVEPDLGNRTLSNLVRLRLFVTYFGWLADRQFSHNRQESRFAAHRRDNPRLYKICVRLDMCVLVVAVLLAFATVAIAIFKTTLR